MSTDSENRFTMLPVIRNVIRRTLKIKPYFKVFNPITSKLTHMSTRKDQSNTLIHFPVERHILLSCNTLDLYIDSLVK
jgi:hypothetical protein